MSHAGNSGSNGDQGSDVEQVRQQTRENLLKKIDDLTVRVDEQHNFLEGLKFILSNTWMSTEASREVLLELFPPDVLVHPACLKFPLLFRMMREVLEFVGIAVESRQGLYVPQAVSSALYASDNVMKSTADRYISEYKHDAHSAARGQSSSTQTQDTSQRVDGSDVESG